MKELLEGLPEITLSHAEGQGYTLIDTCFLIHIFEHHEKIRKFEQLLESGKYAITSFNVEELLHVEHHLHDKIKEELRHFLKRKPELTIISVDVHPGSREGEEEFIKQIDPHILEIVRDPSDGVLFAVALKLRSNILTRDKHHLYNQMVEHYANEHSVNVLTKNEETSIKK